MGRFSKNLDEPGIPPWVCVVCGKPEYIGCRHKKEKEYSVIRQSEYRSAEKEMDSAQKVSRAGSR